MRFPGILAAAALLSSPSIVRAQPTDDPSAWTQRFKQAALATDVEAMLDAIRAASDPRLNIDGIKGVFQSVKALMGSKTAEYSEEFNEKSVGTFFKRINVAVKYPGTIVFYSVTMARDDAGWQIVQVNVDGNLNKILDVPWPA